MRRLGFEVWDATYISLVQAFAERGDTEGALEAYSELEKRNLSTPRMYSGLIKAFGRAGDIQTAISVFQDMLLRKTFSPTVYTYANLINAAAAADNLPLIGDIMRLVETHPPLDVISQPHRASMVRLHVPLTLQHARTHAHKAHTHTKRAHKHNTTQHNTTQHNTTHTKATHTDMDGDNASPRKAPAV